MTHRLIGKVPTGMILVPPRATENRDIDYQSQIELLQDLKEKNIVIPIGFDVNGYWLIGAEVDDFTLEYANLLIVEYFPPIMDRYGEREQLLVKETVNKLLTRLEPYKEKVYAVSLGSDNNGKWGYRYSLISADFPFKKYREDVMTIAHGRGYKILWGVTTLNTGPCLQNRPSGETWDEMKKALDENLASGVDFPSIQYYPIDSRVRTEKQEVENLQSILKYIRSKNIEPTLFEFGICKRDSNFDSVLYAQLLKEMLIQEKILSSWFYTLYDHRGGLYWGNGIWNPVKYVFYP